MNLLDCNQAKLRDFCLSLNEKAFHASQIMRWIHQRGIADLKVMSNLSRTLQDKLLTVTTIDPPQILKQYLSKDGTCKWLFDMGNHSAIEAVFIPETERGTLCISSQIGCALKCTFCATGHQGFNRNLTTAEIIGQLWLAQKTLGAYETTKRVISNVVLMGMGEPLANFEAVVAALDIMLDDHAYGLSRRRVTVSTAGMVPQIAELARTLPVALAVSLHAPNDAIRNRLVPLNKKYPLSELMAACYDYLNYAPRDFITFEYIMLDGINDQLEHARELIKLVSKVPCKINLIPFNPSFESDLRTSTPTHLQRFRDVLQQADIVVTVRKTRGDDIYAACGQLAGKVQDKTNRSTKFLVGPLS